MAVRDLAPYSQDIGWLISLIQDNDADGWLRTKGMLGNYFEEEGREGDALIPQDHEVAYTYLDQLEPQEQNFLKGKMIEFEEPSFGDVLKEGGWESIRYIPKAVGGMTAQWAEGVWGAKIDRRRENDRRSAQREATREGRGEEFADMYREPELPENYQRFKNFSDGMIAELREERERAYDNDPHLRGYMRWAQETPVAINPFKEGFIGRPKIIARAISQMIPSAAAMLAGVGTAVATKSPFAGTAVASTLMGFLEGTDEFQQAVAYNLDQGLDMDEATSIASKSSALYAVGSTFLESLPMGRFFRLMNPARREALRSGLWRRIHGLTADKYRAWRLNNPKSAYKLDMFGTQSMYEGLQEFSQYLTQVAIQEGYKDETFSEIFDVHEAGESAYSGALMGGIFGGGAYLANQYLGNLPSDKELEIREESSNDEVEVYKGPLGVAGTLSNYLKQVLAPQVGKRRLELVDVEQDSPVEELQARHQAIGGEIGQKVGDIISEGGMEVYESLTAKEQVFVENILKGMIMRRSPELAKAVGDPVKAVAEGKIRISRLKPTAALLAGQQKTGSMVRVMEDQITQDWLSQYPASLIQQELQSSLKRGLTASSLSQWAEGQGVDIKGTMEKEFIKSMREQARIENLEPGSMEQYLLSELDKNIQIEYEVEALKSFFGAPLGVDQSTGQLIALADDAASDSDVQAQDAPGNKAHVVDGPYKGQEITFAVQPPEIANDEVAVELPDGEVIHLKKNQIGFIMPSMVDPEAAPQPPSMTDEEVEAAVGVPVTPAGIKTKDFRTMTEGKKEAAVQGDKSAQAEWAVEEVSEFYSAVEGGNISEIREEAMGLLRLAQHWPDNADVRLTVRKVIKDINKVFPTKESFNEAFDKWKAAKIKKGQAQEGVYVEDLKKTLEEIGKGIFKEKSTPLIDIFEDAGTMTQEELDTAVVEEYLARQVANVYITMASESLPAKAARWIKRFYRKLKNMFRTTKFNKNDVIDIFAEELYGTDPLYSVPQSAQGKLKRWAASINNEQGEGFDESLTEDPEDEQDETLGEDASPADFVFKRFEESTQKLFGAPLLNSEVATLIHKARELEVDVGSIEGMKQFLTYIRAAGFAQNTNRKVMFLADFEGKQKKKKTLNRKERNAFIRFYNHANDTIRRSTKVFLQSVDGDVQLKSSEKDFMGNTQSEFINKSFIDDLDVGEDTVMMLGSDVFAETRYSKWRNFEDPQYGPDFLNFEDIEFLEDQLSYFESEKGSPRPMALLGIKGADKNAFMIVRVGNQFRYKNGALWKDKKVVEYFRDEIAAGRMTEQHLKDIEESALTRAEENDFVLLQAAARHNWWKSVMGNNYLMEDDMQTRGVKDYFNRTRIPFNEGSTPRGLGDTRVMVMDMDTIEIEYEDANGNVVRRDPKEDYTETGEPRYFGDGFLGVNDRIISGVEEATGRKPEANEYPLSEFKPSFYHITEDKESVLAIKANASKPPPGLRFLDKATGRLVMETREDENGQMHFYDGNGVEFDMFATKDEAKRNTGQFDVTNEVFDYNFPETSMKVIFGSSPKGKPSAAHPLSWYEMFIAPDLMKDPDVAKALELAGFHILDIMQENIITLIKGRWNPSFLKRNLKRMGILDSYGSLKEGKIVNRIKAGALRHSAFLGRYRSSLGNMLIKKTAFKGRRTGQGTLFTIYPDWKNEVAEDEIIVGDMNEVTIKRVADKVIGKKDRSASKKERGIREEWDALYKNKETRDDAVNQLNAVLAVEDIKTLVHRQPIPDVGSPRILRIKEIRIGLGNVAIPNSKVLYNIMQGDNDGDHLALEFLPDKLTNALEKAVNSKAFKNRKKSIKLGIFKHDTHTGNLANFDDIKKFTSMVSVGQFAQGISVNAKNIRELLSYKDIVVGLTDKGKTAHLENAKLAFLPSNSNVIMDYAPLDIDVLTADGGIVMKQLMENDKVKIITSDGKFIKTPEELLKFAGRETSMPSRISSAKAPQAIAKFFTPIHDSIKGMTVSAYMKMHGPRTLTGKVEFLRNENKPNEFLLLETTSEGTRAFGYVSDKKASLMGRQDMYGFKLNNIYQQGEVYGLVGKEYIEKNYGLTWEGTIGGDERPFVTSVTEETGENEVYLYTTSAHEMATILQASVDNAKELLLYGWGWGNEDLYGKSGYNFLFSRMIADKRNIRKMKDGSWKDADSPKGAPSVTKSLLKEEGALTMMRHIFNFFNYSQFRQGRDKNRRSLGLQEIGRRSFDKANFIASTPEEKGARVKRHMFTSDKRLKKLVKSVTMNNRFTSLEQGFAKYFKLAREQIKNHGEEGEVLNWDVTRYNHTRLKNAFIFARDSINANFAHLVDKYKVPIAEGDLEAAKKFARLMHTRFYNIGKDKMYIAEDGTEYDATEDRVVRNEYSKMMGAFIEDHIHQFLALSPGAQFLHTHMFLNALERSDVRINKRGGVSAMITDAADKLLPWELMDEDLSIEYLDAWSDGLDASSNTEERVAQEKWKDTRVDIAQDKYEIDNGCRVASK